MKIIFDSKEERNDFFERLAYGSITCPSDIGLNDCDVFGKSCESNCGSCWENALQHEVKDATEDMFECCTHCIYFDAESTKPICLSCNWHTNNHDDPYRDYYSPTDAPHKPCLTCVHLGNGVTNEGLGECEECINYSNYTRLKRPEA